MSALVSCDSPNGTEEGIDATVASIRTAADAGVLHGAASVLVAGEEPRRILTGRDRYPDGAAIGASSNFRLASLTKLFTQVAILRLVDQGRIDLDAPLRTYRSSLQAEWADEVTIRDLLAFRSGLPREWNVADPESSGVEFDEAGLALPFLDALAHIGPVVPIGTRTTYSNLGYMHLGAVLESVTEGSFADAIEELVVEPAGLGSTGFGMDVLGADGHVRGHRRDEAGRIELIGQYDIAGRYAAGGLYSSLDDLETLSQCLLDGDLLSAASTDELFAQFGRPNIADTNVLQASGHVPGFANTWLMVREPASAIILLNNVAASNPKAVVDAGRTALAAWHESTLREADADPLVGEGWTRVASFEAVPTRPSLGRIRAYVESLAGDDTDEVLRCLMSLQGFNLVELDDEDVRNLRNNAAYEHGAFQSFGPFRLTAWRLAEGKYLELYFQGPDGRAIQYGFAAAESNADVVAEKRHSTIGFRP
jgi:CubicO group peptidase (beta-lactamase class C family)